LKGTCSFLLFAKKQKKNLFLLLLLKFLIGIIKTVVAMEKGIIPGNLHFQTPNPDIDFNGMHLSVVSKTIPWPSCETKVRIRRREGKRERGWKR
jgi:hypothetical protein